MYWHDGRHSHIVRGCRLTRIAIQGFSAMGVRELPKSSRWDTTLMVGGSPFVRIMQRYLDHAHGGWSQFKQQKRIEEGHGVNFGAVLLIDRVCSTQRWRLSAGWPASSDPLDPSKTRNGPLWDPLFWIGMGPMAIWRTQSAERASQMGLFCTVWAPFWGIEKHEILKIRREKNTQ